MNIFRLYINKAPYSPKFASTLCSPKLNHLKCSETSEVLTTHLYPISVKKEMLFSAAIGTRILKGIWKGK